MHIIESSVSRGRRFFWIQCVGERPELVQRIIARYGTRVWMPEIQQPILRPAGYDEVLDFAGAFPDSRRKYPIAGLAERMKEHPECYFVYDARHKGKGQPYAYLSGRVGSVKQPVIVPAVRI